MSYGLTLTNSKNSNPKLAIGSTEKQRNISTYVTRAIDFFIAVTTKRPAKDTTIDPHPINMQL
jgi:hypothetical protein